jgi:hypothetical protein
MKKMINLVLAATLICGASVFTSCDNNSDNPVNPDPSETTVPRINKIFRSTHIIVKRNMGGTWITLSESESERTLKYEFFWTGNRLDSIKEMPSGVVWEMEYDEQGRLIHDYSTGGNYDRKFEYDSKGRLSKMHYAILWDEGIYNRYITSYIYEGDKVTKTIKTGSIYNLQGGPFTKTEECVFTWDGDNVVAMSEVRTDAEGNVEASDNCTIEYSANLNPFRNVLHFMAVGFGLSIEDEAWAMSKNVPSSINTGENTLNEYDSKTTGDLVTSFHSHTLADSPIIFMESEADCDFEYLP